MSPACKFFTLANRQLLHSGLRAIYSFWPGGKNLIHARVKKMHPGEGERFALRQPECKNELSMECKRCTS